MPSGAANALGPTTGFQRQRGALAAAGIRTFVATSPSTARGVLADAVAAGVRGGSGCCCRSTCSLPIWTRATRRRRGCGERKARSAAPAGDRGCRRRQSAEPQAADPGRTGRAHRAGA